MVIGISVCDRCSESLRTLNVSPYTSLLFISIARAFPQAHFAHAVNLRSQARDFDTDWRCVVHKHTCCNCRQQFFTLVCIFISNEVACIPYLMIAVIIIARRHCTIALSLRGRFNSLRYVLFSRTRNSFVSSSLSLLLSLRIYVNNVLLAFCMLVCRIGTERCVRVRQRAPVGEGFLFLLTPHIVYYYRVVLYALCVRVSYDHFFSSSVFGVCVTTIAFHWLYVHVHLM